MLEEGINFQVPSTLEGQISKLYLFSYYLNNWVSPGPSSPGGGEENGQVCFIRGLCHAVPVLSRANHCKKNGLLSCSVLRANSFLWNFSFSCANRLRPLGMPIPIWISRGWSLSPSSDTYTPSITRLFAFQIQRPHIPNSLEGRTVFHIMHISYCFPHSIMVSSKWSKVNRHELKF
jgi:hypothetical protein